MSKLLSTSYIILFVVLGGITITTALATTVTITYPYIITDGNTTRLVIGSSGNMGVGSVTTNNPPGLINLRQIVDTNLGGMVFQNHAAAGSMRFWEDSSNNGHISGGGGADRFIITSTGVYFPAGTPVGIGITTPTQPLDVVGNVHITGNLTTTPAKELAITTTNGKDICIGSC